jgi:AraC-like DNA-binding protein
VVRHVGPPGEPPTPAEDALVLGIVAALCRHVGARDLTVTALDAGGAELPVLTPAGFREPAAAWCRPGALATWRFAWSGGADPLDPGRPRPGTVEGDDATGDAGSGADASSIASRLAAVIAADLGRTWTVAAAARALDRAGGPSLAPRTLQRRLAAEQATFPGVVRSARVAAAGRLLAGGGLAVGVVGFVCGFSDQPHFTRQFRRVTGLTPAAYRRAFSAGAR